METRVSPVLHDYNRATGIETIDKEGQIQRIEGEHFISSLPVRELVRSFAPLVPEIVEAADRLQYRDFLTVALIIDTPRLSHEPDVRLGRIQNFKNWSADMVADSSKTCLGLEYFCFEGDGL